MVMRRRGVIKHPNPKDIHWLGHSGLIPPQLQQEGGVVSLPGKPRMGGAGGSNCWNMSPKRVGAVCFCSQCEA